MPFNPGAFDSQGTTVQTLRLHRAGILAWTRLRISNGALEGMNNKVGLRGFVWVIFVTFDQIIRPRLRLRSTRHVDGLR